MDANDNVLKDRLKELETIQKGIEDLVDYLNADCVQSEILLLLKDRVQSAMDLLSHPRSSYPEEIKIGEHLRFHLILILDKAPSHLASPEYTIRLIDKRLKDEYSVIDDAWTGRIAWGTPLDLAMKLMLAIYSIGLEEMVANYLHDIQEEISKIKQHFNSKLTLYGSSLLNDMLNGGLNVGGPEGLSLTATISEDKTIHIKLNENQSELPIEASEIYTLTKDQYGTLVDKLISILTERKKLYLNRIDHINDALITID